MNNEQIRNVWSQTGGYNSILTLLRKGDFGSKVRF